MGNMILEKIKLMLTTRGYDMAEYRNLRDIRVMPIILIFLNLFGILIFYFKQAGLSYEWLYLINEVEIIDIGSFLLLFIFFLIITNLKVNASEEVTNFINRKLNYMNYLNIIYLIIVMLTVRDKIIMIAAFNIEIYFLSIYLITRNIYADKLRYSMGKHEEVLKKDKSSILWRLKLWIDPYEKVKISDRLSAIKPFDIISIVIFIVLFQNNIGGAIIFLVLRIKTLLLILEVIIPIQTSISGVCTEIVEKSTSKGSSTYYGIYITDYEKRREYILRVNEYPYISTGQKLTVVHGAISKRPIYVKEIKLHIR